MLKTSNESGILQILDQSFVDEVILAKSLDHEHSLLTYGTQSLWKIYVLDKETKKCCMH